MNKIKYFILILIIMAYLFFCFLLNMIILPLIMSPFRGNNLANVILLMIFLFFDAILLYMLLDGLNKTYFFDGLMNKILVKRGKWYLPIVFFLLFLLSNYLYALTNQPGTIADGILWSILGVILFTGTFISLFMNIIILIVNNEKIRHWVKKWW